MAGLEAPFRRIIVATVLLMAPTAGALGIVLGTVGERALIPAVIIILSEAVGILLVTWVFHSDFKGVSSYIEEITEIDEETTPPPEMDFTGSESAHALTSSLARLHQNWRRRLHSLDQRINTAEAILDIMATPLLLIDDRRRVTHFNLAARDLFGEALLFRDVATAMRAPHVLESIDETLAGHPSPIIEYRTGDPERIFELRAVPLPRGLEFKAIEIGYGGDSDASKEDLKDHPTVAFITLYDITDIRRSEQMRVDFVANVSHELRTPLSALIGFIETLAGPARNDTEAQGRFLKIMAEQASRMDRLVNDLLWLSRIEMTEHTQPTGHVNIHKLLNSVAGALELKAGERQMRIVVNAGSHLPTVTGDEDQLAQVFQNLVSNAIKYGRPGTDIKVTASFTHTTDPIAKEVYPMLEIAVEDRGEGIPRNHLPRLTERFYRVDHARNREVGGTGLGLAIVKHILNRHKARLVIESQVRVGSTFTVFLPVTPGDLRGRDTSEAIGKESVPSHPRA